MVFNDLREFIDEARARGEYKLVEGADWDLEIGGITEWQQTLANPPVLMFDKIKGVQPGFRVATNLFCTPRRTMSALGLPGEAAGLEQVKQIRARMHERFNLLPPIEVKDGPVKENIVLGDKVDIYKFPSPKWHPPDGGRYFGTCHTVIQKDPDTGWVNLGTYRVQVHGKDRVTAFIEPGRHGGMIAEKWWSRGQNCPIAIATGIVPSLWAASTRDVPLGVSEYDYAGGWQGKPIAITRGITVDLPIPATAEIVLEGEMIKNDTVAEGPFGEWTGYTFAGSNKKPIIKVNAILHRNDPIIAGAPPSKKPSHFSLALVTGRAAAAWDYIDKLIPGVQGVWMQDYMCFGPLVISIKQMFPGHAKQAALAILSNPATAFMCPYIIVVDDDIDPSDTADVLWAVQTRCDPGTSIDILRQVRALSSVPTISPENRKRGDYTINAAILLAVKPFVSDTPFPARTCRTEEELKEIEKQWADRLK